LAAALAAETEVQNMLITEYDRDMDIAVNRREAWEDGREDGLTEGMEFAARNALAKGLSLEFVQEITGLGIDAVEAIRGKL
jgi:flagellar biosynthesis/type III secretory pathway protein FliH